MSVKIKQAAILCGGLGSRLGALTAETPKPLLPVNGTPFLQLLIQEVSRYGIERFLLLASYRSEQIEQFALEVPRALGRNIHIDVAIEPHRAGTGGALFHARDQLDDAFYLLNGDTLLDTPLQTLANLLDTPQALGALALRPLQSAGRYGVTVLDGDTVTQFGVRPVADGPVLINGGVGAFRKEIIDRLEPSGSLENDLLTPLALEGRLRGVAVDGFFLDIGIPSDFQRAQSEIPAFRRRPALFLDRDGVINIDHGHVGTIDRFEWVEGAPEAISLANALGFYVFIVTNQAGIGKGLYSLEEYHVLSRHIRDAATSLGARIDDERYCPDHPDAVLEAYRRKSSWRKPEPGMLRDLIEKWPLDLGASFLIGDRETDIVAAHAAGIDGYRFQHGRLDDFLKDILNERGLGGLR
ncbi:MAG: HAD-IIIA family hydrolase [Proteobacteria bacterium]|nr:HAD-IIIA family hydrolase [Pseudomonadota bacterium]